MSLENLRHVRHSIPSGGMVLVLETGALINPESEAMLQALHSRSLGGIDSHLTKLAKSGSEKFMSMFYVGYGHKSIGDCGSITIFVEGISMLAAKALQQYPLYNGQESSTRYVDYEHQPFIDPIGTDESRAILEQWRSFYLESLPVVRDELKARHPRQEDEEEKIYEKAINARSFDIMRGFLPSGASTNIAWHTELRHAADHLAVLRHHPLAEVRDVALAIERALIEKFPSSFSDKRYTETERYNDSWMRNEYYFHDTSFDGQFVVERNDIDTDILQAYAHVLRERPLKTELPKFLASAGTMRFGFLLDFGSFRDIQRHRAVTQRMPLVTSAYGFEEWYLDQLPKALRSKAETCISEQMQSIEQCNADPLIAQYYLPMGMRVRCMLTGDLPALVYLVERRARLDVHPTLRKVAQHMGETLIEDFKEIGLTLYMETEGDRFYYKRGTQDIIEKQT